MLHSGDFYLVFRELRIQVDVIPKPDTQPPGSAPVLVGVPRANTGLLNDNRGLTLPGSSASAGSNSLTVTVYPDGTGRLQEWTDNGENRNLALEIFGGIVVTVAVVAIVVFVAPEVTVAGGLALLGRIVFRAAEWAVGAALKAV